MKWKWVPVLMACAVALGGTVNARAQGFPNKPITVIVPFAAGASPTSSPAWSPSA